jgi:hypothetical protein
MTKFKLYYEDGAERIFVKDFDSLKKLFARVRKDLKETEIDDFMISRCEQIKVGENQ